ncbi:HDOD domain-containing protein [Adhaeretor mobilis]|uniref:HDOD domain protein n=1 Tax=Adhaeretor mobilis TaxID=1930276 RepID=A0A517N2T9_9BACT|nr:HDOD domain-containing protein [Adhaeretor mobilis]QDT01452.1 HDOD domain protein [Adhaeretor mobilis]
MPTINSAPTVAATKPSSPPLATLVRRSSSLYTLPAVAAEVLRLTECPQVDAQALKECIERDPALTAKVLRVVNSSLFGLSSGVSDLNQAVAMLGVKPLKLLVLGFSLPENLFVNVAAEELQWYWRTTLARAVAAREISEHVFGKSGNDAFLAGLLQGIGILALLGELGATYAEFISRVIAEQGDLSGIEDAALGFDHRELTAALLTQWRLPNSLVDAIRQPRVIRILARGTDDAHRLRQSAHLGDLLAQLVAQRRIKVLPELLEAADAYAGLNRDQLNALVATLQEHVEQLADVLSVSLPEQTDYLEVVAEAHERLAGVAEETTKQLGPVSADDEMGSAELAGKTALLQSAVATLAETPDVEQGDSQLDSDSQEPAEKDQNCARESAKPQAVAQSFENRLTLTVGQCRAARQPLSVIWLAVEASPSLDSKSLAVLNQLFDAVCRQVDHEGTDFSAVEPATRAVLLADCERSEAIDLAHQALQRLRSVLKQLAAGGKLPPCTLSAGVATVALAPKNFPPAALLETAQRCQAAAQAAGTVKSLEIC